MVITYLTQCALRLRDVFMSGAFSNRQLSGSQLTLRMVQRSLQLHLLIRFLAPHVIWRKWYSRVYKRAAYCTAGIVITVWNVQK